MWLMKWSLWQSKFLTINWIMLLQQRISFLLVWSLWPCTMKEQWIYGICLAISLLLRMMLVRTEHLLLFRNCKSSTMQYLYVLWQQNWLRNSFLISRYFLLNSCVGLSTISFSFQHYLPIWSYFHFYKKC